MKLGLGPLALFGMLVLCACANGDDASTSRNPETQPASSSGAAAPPPPATTTTTTPCASPPCENNNPVVDPPSEPVSVKWLGASGFLVKHGGESVLTAPLFTRPDMITVSMGIAAKSDGNLVDANLDAKTLSSVRAIISGHAHYDHLLDAPTILQKAPQALLYSNVSARNLIASYAPDRAAACSGKPAQSPTIARSRVIALDDPMTSAIDWTNCPSKKPANAPNDGKWVDVPGSNVRVLGVCSEHPDQVGPYHFGPGDVEEEQCEPPSKMADWKEGVTIAFLVDFLDPKTHAPIFRFYYQDAPTNAPVGHVPPKFLADRQVDIALLCVGSSNNVEDEPTGILTSLKPRAAIGGHWEDFFRSMDSAPQPIAFLDVDKWKTQATNVLVPQPSSPWTINGKTGITERVVVPQFGDTFEMH